jgi:hypothetical protein
MSEAVQIALVTAVLNGAVTWGVMTTKLAWMRRDLDEVRDFVFKKNLCSHG